MNRTDIRWEMATRLADRIIFYGAIALIIWMVLR